VQVGGGYLYAVAQEGALKLIETASLPVLSYSAADVLHGPIAVAGPDVPVICYSTPGPLANDVSRVATEAAERGASVFWAGEDPPVIAHELPVHAVLPEALMPLLHTVRAQQLALAVSRALGADADRPRGLRKVTLT
jgi:glucosamine--fructose-6-phosphate aminotransferase (isomerizing)